MKYMYYYNKKDYTLLKERLLRTKLGFIEEVNGSNRNLSHANVMYKSYHGDSIDTGMGFHLVAMVKRDIDTLFDGKDVPIRECDYKEQYFNIPALEAFTGKIAVSIDISDCYWTTALLNGFITERTYLMGKRKGKDWKVGRVASIGSLSKRKVTKFYNDGHEILENRIVEDMPMKYQYARHNIIGRVYDLFKQLNLEIADGYLMYLTDCVVVEPRYVKYVRRFMFDYGYRFKEKSVEILGVDKVKRVVHWHEFPEKLKDGTFDGEGKDKYYQYCDDMLVFDVKDIKRKI